MAEYLTTIANQLGVHHVTLWRWSKREGFPQPESTEERWPRYDPKVVREWMETCAPVNTPTPRGSKLVNGKIVAPRKPRHLAR